MYGFKGRVQAVAVAGLACVGLMAVAATPASAAVVFNDSSFANPGWINYYRLSENICGADPCGEANDISITVSGSNYVITDTAGMSATGDSNLCDQVDATTAVCPTSWSTEWDADLGASNDTISVRLPATSYVSIQAGEGNDIMRPGRESDNLDGSGGFDTVDYSSSRRVTGTTDDGPGTGVTVNLASGGSGAGTFADGDSFYLVDRVLGSAYGDTLIGGPDPETLAGGEGRDRLTGGGAADKLLGGDANDRLFSNGDGANDINNCGLGENDRLRRDPGDTANSCEVRPLG